MKQNPLWMRPALQPSEAVLLPALVKASTDSIWLPLGGEMEQNDPFVTSDIDGMQTEENTQLSTYVRSRGSMAGRGVLRAVGHSHTPVGVSTYQRPQYYTKQPRMLRNKAMFGSI